MSLQFREHQLQVKEAELKQLRIYVKYLESQIELTSAHTRSPMLPHVSIDTSDADKISGSSIAAKSSGLGDSDVTLDDKPQPASQRNVVAPISHKNSIDEKSKSAAEPMRVPSIRPISLSALHIPSDRILHDLWVNRKAMSHHFGGDHLRDRPVSAKYSAFSNTLFLDNRINVHAPQKAGEPGLFLSLFPPDSSWHKIERLMVGSGCRNSCQYMGDYRLVDVKPARMTAEEWCLLPTEARKQWVLRIRTRKNDQIKSLQARILLRDCNDSGAEPTPVQIRRKIRAEDWRVDNDKQIYTAYETGQEQLYIWGLQCVAFDFDFQDEIVRAVRAQECRDGLFSSKKQSTGSSKRKRAEEDSGSDTEE